MQCFFPGEYIFSGVGGMVFFLRGVFFPRKITLPQCYLLGSVFFPATPGQVQRTGQWLTSVEAGVLLWGVLGVYGYARDVG